MPSNTLCSPLDDDAARRELEAIHFCYWTDDSGRLQQRKAYRQVIVGVLQPFRQGSAFTYDDVDTVYDTAALALVRRHARGGLRLGLTHSYSRLAFHGTGVSFIRSELNKRSGKVSLDAGLTEDEDAVAVIDYLKAPKSQEPQQRVLLRLLSDSLREVIAELPEQQLRAFRLRDLCDFETDHIDHALIGEILDRTDGVSNSAHTTAYHAAKQTLQRNLVAKLGWEPLRELLHELGITLELNPALPPGGNASQAVG